MSSRRVVEGPELPDGELIGMGPLEAYMVGLEHGVELVVRACEDALAAGHEYANLRAMVDSLRGANLSVHTDGPEAEL